MKKTLLSVLAGLTVIGSASALPTPEDRKAMCLKHPDKYVWVEKKLACVPINPCESADKTIKDAYCISIFEFSPHNTEVRDMVITRYTENVMRTTVSEIKTLTDNADNIIIAVKTTDGDYYANKSQKYPYKNQRTCDLDTYPAWAGAAYGKPIKSSLWAHQWDEYGEGTMLYYKNVTSAKTCRDIADFLSLISGQLMTPYKSGNECDIFCPGKE